MEKFQGRLFEAWVRPPMNGQNARIDVKSVDVQSVSEQSVDVQSVDV